MSQKILIDADITGIAEGISNASTTVKGLVELATTAEATTGTDTERAVTPAGLKAATDNLVPKSGDSTITGKLTTTMGLQTTTVTTTNLVLNGYTISVVS